MKVLIIGEIYSENLGDGAIAEANKYLLEQYCGSETRFLDISNRYEFASCEIRKNESSSISIVKYIKKINKVFMRNSIYSSFIFLTILQFRERKKLLDNLKRNIVDVDLAIIGGGQLLMDNHLSFPVRLYTITKFLDYKSIPFVFSSIGVSDNWSIIGKKIVSKIFRNPSLRRVSVRDHLSKRYLNNIFSQKEVAISVDSAIFVDESFKITKKNESNLFGLGITNVASLAFGNNHNQDYSKMNVVDMWIDVIKFCETQGYEVELFTNGSKEDFEFSNQIANEYKSRFNTSIRIAERPLTPFDLVNTVSKYKLIVAHRLHSNIIAYSLKIPSIGLGWDPKVESFGSIINRERFFLKAKDVCSDKIIKLLEDSETYKFDQDHYDNLKRSKIKYMQHLVRSK